MSDAGDTPSSGPDPTSEELPNPRPGPPANPMIRALGDMRQHLSHLEAMCGVGVGEAEARLKPIWQEAIEGEHRLPVAGAIAVAVVLQIALPKGLNIRPTWLLPALETALLIGLVAANPRRIDRESKPLRTASMLLIAVITLGNAWSAGHLIRGLITGTLGSNAGPLLASGASIYLTNVILFGLWYWELDRGGPVARLQGRKPYPDFLFPQMSSAALAPPDWRPEFLDYLYISFTNATAFSPTDVLPLTRWAKTLMAVQAGVSLSTVALVVARAVNILK